MRTFAGRYEERLLSWEVIETRFFRNQLEALDRDVKIRMSKAIMDEIKADPYSRRSKNLRGELEGIRRIHVGPNYCVAYIVCDECRKRGYESKILCLDCHERQWYHIKLVSCGPREDFYKNLQKNWRTWMGTVSWQRFIQESGRRAFLSLLSMPSTLVSWTCMKTGRTRPPESQAIHHPTRSYPSPLNHLTCLG